MVIRIFHGWPRTTSQSADYAIPDTRNTTVLMSAAAASRTVTLPASPRTNQVVIVKMTGASGTNTVTIARNGKNIDGAAANLTLYILNDCYTLQYDGTAWQIIGATIAAHCCRLYRAGASAAQALTVNTTSTIQLNTLDGSLDVGGLGNTGTYTITTRRAGRYRGVASIMLGTASMVAGNHVQANLAGMGAVNVSNRQFFVASSAQVQVTETCTTTLAAGVGVSFTVEVTGTSGTRSTIQDASFGPYLELTEVR